MTRIRVPYFTPWINSNDKKLVLNSLNQRWLTGGPNLKLFENNVCHPDTVIVFNFHPIHLYLNTKSLEHYEKSKSDFFIEKRLRQHINIGKGIKTDFLELIRYIKNNDEADFKTLGEVNKAMRKRNDRN